MGGGGPTLIGSRLAISALNRAFSWSLNLVGRAAIHN
jgi:hypothetical protein